MGMVPVLVMLPLSVIAGLQNQNTNEARPFRDGLAAAYVVVLLISFTTWAQCSCMPFSSAKQNRET